MRAVLTAVIAAIEAAAVALAGLVLIAIPVTLIWWLTFDLAADPGVIAVASAAGWLLAHLAPLSFTLDATQTLAFGLPAEPLTFVVTLAPLGITALTVALAARSGARFAQRGGVGLAGVLGGAVAFGTVATAAAGVAEPVRAEGVLASALLPTLVYLVASGAGFLVRSAVSGQTWWQSFVRLLQRGAERVNGLWAARLPILLADTLRLTMAVTVALVGFAALGVTVALIGGYVGVITLSEGLHLDWVGVLAVFLASLALLPVAIIWAIAWFSGAGFVLGAGSSVTPFETLLGPLPAFPLFGAIPQGWGWAGALAPAMLVVLGIAIGAWASARSELRRSLSQRSWIGAVSSALLAAVLLGLIVAGLMVLASGAIGPGRLAVAGPEVWPVAGLIVLEVGSGLVLGVLGGRLDVARLRAAVQREAVPVHAVPVETATVETAPVEIHDRVPAEAPNPPLPLEEDPLLRAFSWHSGESDSVGLPGSDATRLDPEEEADAAAPAVRPTWRGWPRPRKSR